MKNIALIGILTLILSCSTEKEQEQQEVIQSNIVANFLNDVTSLEKEESETPILKFQEVAINTAEKIIELNKQSIESCLSEAKAYKYCVIITGNHTIVKIDDLSNCKQSGSWSACMPYAEGYVKKGELIFHKDYINNIIGLPDGQKRTVYLFN